LERPSSCAIAGTKEKKKVCNFRGDVITKEASRLDTKDHLQLLSAKGVFLGAGEGGVFPKKKRAKTSPLPEKKGIHEKPF